MINIRNNIFETNSSSVHSLVLKKHKYPKVDKIVIRPMQTDDMVITDIEDKVSYLASFIIFNANIYGDLTELEDNYSWNSLKNKVKEILGCDIEFCEGYNPDAIEINHQLQDCTDLWDLESELGPLETILDEATQIVVDHD